MRNAWKIAVVVLLVAAVVVIVALKRKESAPSAAGAASRAGTPQLLELGSTTCIPCQQMAPILDELKKEYAGRLKVDFIDVFKQKQIADQYHVRVIPTQVFFDAHGREFFRHEGFFPKEDILQTFRRHKVDLGDAS